MRNIFRIISIDLIILSGIVFFVLLRFAIPDFDKYNTEILEIVKRSRSATYFFHDLNQDKNIEEIELIDANNIPVINVVSKGKVHQLRLSKHFLEKKLTFGKYINDRYTECAFLTKSNDSVFLNIFSFTDSLRFLVKDRFISKIRKNHFGGFDIRAPNFQFFHDVNKDSYPEVIFSLIAEYSFQPRNIFAFDIKNDTVYRSAENGAYFVGTDTIDIDRDGFVEFYYTTFSTSNWPKGWIGFKYPDTCAWFSVVNSDFKYTFTPVGFSGVGSVVKVQPLVLRDSSFFAVFHSTSISKTNPVLYLYNSKGQIIRKRTFDRHKFKNLHAFADAAPDFRAIYLHDMDGFIYKLDKNLNIKDKKRIINPHKHKNIKYASYELNNDGNKELIYIYYNGIIIFDNNLERLASVEIKHPDFINPSVVKSGQQTKIFFQDADNIHYSLSFTANNLYQYKFLLLISLYLTIFGFLYLLKRAWRYKLFKDNQKLQNEIAKSIKEIQLKNDEIKENNDFRQAIFSMFVHDLKNPLQAILHLADKSDTHYNGKLKAYAYKMLEEISDILDINKFESVGVKLNIEEHRIYNCVEAAIEKIVQLATPKGVVIKNKIQTNCIATFDFALIERVCLNILSNAIKHCHYNSDIIVQCEKDEVYGLRIEFMNFGNEIPKESLPNIFNKLISGRKNNKNYSTGLGLYFCRLIIEAHGEKIGDQIIKDKGNLFWFTLPGTKMGKNEIPMKKKKAIDNEKTLFSTFSPDDISKIQKYTTNFKSIELFEISKLYAELNKITDDNNAVIIWKKELKEAINFANKESYEKLINI